MQLLSASAYTWARDSLSYDYIQNIHFHVCIALLFAQCDECAFFNSMIKFVFSSFPDLSLSMCVLYAQRQLPHILWVSVLIFPCMHICVFVRICVNLLCMHPTNVRVLFSGQCTALSTDLPRLILFVPGKPSVMGSRLTFCSQTSAQWAVHVCTRAEL